MPFDGVWHIVDGWATEEEARHHAAELRKNHDDKVFKVKHSPQHPYGGGPWLVLYSEAADDD